EALVEIQAALAQIPDEPGPRLHIELRRLDIVFLKQGGAPALRELDSFVGRVRKDPDKEFWKYASSQLAALATRLFARQSCDDANEILARCARLNPGSLVEHPYPEKATVELSALPARSRAWLASLEGGPQSPTLLRALWGGSLWGLIGAVALATFTVYVLFDSPRAWGVPGYVFALVCLVGSGLALAASARGVMSAATSEVRPLVTIHPLYLLQTTARQVKVWPLVNLLSVNLTRHSTNGVYTHTQVAAKFGRSSFSTSIRDEAYAKKWADYLLETRRRVLDLLHHGYLEAEPNVDLLPPKLLQPRKERRWQAWRPDRWLQVGAGLGFVLFLAAIPWNARLVDEADFGAAARVGTAKAYGTYLKQHASGRFVEPAKAEIARRYDAAWTSLELGRGPEAPGLDALSAGLKALAEAGQTSLPLVMTWEAGGDAAAAAANDAALEEAVSSAALAQRGRELEGRVRQGLQAMGLAEVAVLERKATVAPATPIALTVHARYGLDGSVLEAGAIRVSGLRVDWRVALEGTAVRGSPFAWETTTASPNALDLTGTAGGGGRAEAYAAELDAACAEFAARLGEALGYGAPRVQPSAAPVQKTALLSPYKK
ncbi:MAG TPA: hypothetical protein VMV21_01145, partial [Vicinamibacteria bacterium]|nr:hypothetical protein [Vicinamibacteria bacterium]